MANDPGMDVGDTLYAAVMSLCVGGMLRTWLDKSDQWWTVDDPARLAAALGSGHVGRGRVGDGLFREVALLNERTGTLVLQPRFPDRPDETTVSFTGQPIRLRPGGEPRVASGEVHRVVRTTIDHVVRTGGFAILALGGWDLHPEPYCRVLLNRETGKLEVDTAPTPAGSPTWQSAILPTGEVAGIGLGTDPQSLDVATQLVVEACMAWGRRPWELAFTFGGGS